MNELIISTLWMYIRRDVFFLWINYTYVPDLVLLCNNVLDNHR
jgi:hypothetical protein